MFFPSFDRASDFHGAFARTHFPNQYAIARQKRNKLHKIDIAGKRRLMILGRPNAILDMATKSARSDLPQPLGVIDKRQVLLDLDVAKVVPVTDRKSTRLNSSHE